MKLRCKHRFFYLIFSLQVNVFSLSFQGKSGAEGGRHSQAAHYGIKTQNDHKGTP